MFLLTFFLYVCAEFLAVWALFELVGFWWTLLVIAGIFSIGVWLIGTRLGSLRRHGIEEAKRDPERVLGDTGAVALGSVLVLLPGPATGVLGILCLLPITRPLIRGLLAITFLRRFTVVARSVTGLRQAAGHAQTRHRGTVVDGTVVDADVAPDPAAEDPDRRAAGRSTDPRHYT